MDKKVRAHIFVSGRVQGVFFREKARQKAQSLGVNGWIQNLADGRVEAVFEGEGEKVEKMVKWSKRGPFGLKLMSFLLNGKNIKANLKNLRQSI